MITSGRKWPTVQQVMARAVMVRVVPGHVAPGLSWYRESDDGPEIKIHAATLSNLLNTLRGARWQQLGSDPFTYVRPTPCTS